MDHAMGRRELRAVNVEADDVDVEAVQSNFRIEKTSPAQPGRADDIVPVYLNVDPAVMAWLVHDALFR